MTRLEELIARSQAGDMAAKEILLKENTGLIWSVTRRFTGRGVESDDLYQLGCLGFIKAIDGFDLQYGTQFSTYAVPVILGEIKRLFRDGGSVKISRSLKELSLKATRVRESLSLSLGYEPTVNQIAEKLGITAQETAQALCAAHLPLSLTADSEEGGGQIDVLVPSEEERITNSRSLSQILSKLEDCDRDLIILRYYKNKTQTETAKELNMTQVQVSRREKKLLSFMREKLLL